MAGTIPSLSLSTQFDKNGRLLRGGKVYWFQANTLVPQNAYGSVGLDISTVLPNPYTIDGSGRVPEFYCADGFIRVRVTDRSGIVQIDAPNALVVGPSSGEGGGGGSVDANAIFKVGDVLWLDQGGARSGFVRDNGRTIGSATSGASERANADCEPLFLFLWQTYPDAVAPVTGGRGLTAAADWAANKVIATPDKRGKLPGGLDDMGNSAANRFTGVPFTYGNATTVGAIGGEARHTLTESELAAHDHGITDPGHTHSHDQSQVAGVGGQTQIPDTGPGPLTTGSSTTGITVNDAGGGEPHNNMPPVVLGTFYRKL